MNTDKNIILTHLFTFFTNYSREEAEKYMSTVEMQADEQENKNGHDKRIPPKKRHARPVPLTSKLPMYDKLLAEKEERCRFL